MPLVLQNLRPLCPPHAANSQALSSFCIGPLPTATVSVLVLIFLCLHSWGSLMNTPNTHEPHLLCLPRLWVQINNKIQFKFLQITLVSKLPLQWAFTFSAYALHDSLEPTFLLFLLMPLLGLFSLLGGMYLLTQPNPTHPQWVISKPVFFHEVFSSFLFFFSAHSLSHYWSNLHLYLSYITYVNLVSYLFSSAILFPTL